MKNKFLYFYILFFCINITAPGIIRSPKKSTGAQKLAQAHECAGETIINSMHAIAAAQKKLALMLERIVTIGVALADGTPEKAGFENTAVEWEKFTATLEELNNLCAQLSKAKL